MRRDNTQRSSQERVSQGGYTSAASSAANISSQQKGIARAELVLLALVLLLALVPRLLFLYTAGFSIESDEAIVGLMAKHMLDGAEIPIFYYGQHYMGSLEPILVAGFFSFLGESNYVLKLVPLLFSLLHVATVYVLARRFVSWHFALLAGLLAAVAPATLLLWSAKARGGFIELVVLGSYSLILAVDCLQSEKRLRWRMALLGFVLGVGWWVNNQIIFYMLPIAAVFMLYFPIRAGVLNSLKLAMLALLGFFVGSAPFWYANLFFEPRFATFTMLFGNSSGGSLVEYLQGFFTTAMPIIIGARRFWSEKDVVPGATLLMSSAYALIFFAILSFSARRKPAAHTSFASLSLLLLFCASVAVVFSASSFGWLSQAPRYLLPLYSVLFVLVAIGIQRFWQRGFRVIAASIFVLLLVGHVVSGFWGGVAIAGEPFVYKGQRVSHSHAALYRWLEANNYRHIHTNYWIGYRTAFETDERVTFTRYGHPKTLRIPEYETAAKKAGLPAVYVLVPAESQLLEQELRQFGYQFRRSEVGAYVVLDQIKPLWEIGEPLSVSAEQVSVFNRSEQRANLFDGDTSTRWGSGMPQHPGMEISIQLAQAQRLSAVEIDFGGFVHDAPRDLEIVGVTPEGNEVVLFRLLGTKTYYELQAQATSEVEPSWSIRFAPQLLSAIKLRQHGSTTVFDWSIAELRLFKAAQQ